MSFSYSYTPTLINFCRFLVADTVDAGHTFEDEEITNAGALESGSMAIIVQGQTTFSTIGSPSPRRVAANLLDALAANQSRLASALTVLDIKIDTKTVASELRNQAKALREVDENSSAFGIAEMCTNDFTRRERWWDQWLRQTTL